jgi:hypothetical protein
MMDKFIQNTNQSARGMAKGSIHAENVLLTSVPEQAPEDNKLVDDRTKQETQEDEEELYSIKNFSL